MKNNQFNSNKQITSSEAALLTAADIQSLTPKQVSELSPAAIKSIKPEIFACLNAEQIKAFTLDQAQAITIGQLVYQRPNVIYKNDIGVLPTLNNRSPNKCAQYFDKFNLNASVTGYAKTNRGSTLNLVVNKKNGSVLAADFGLASQLTCLPEAGSSSQNSTAS